jgi:hypothetical protein
MLSPIINAPGALPGLSLRAWAVVRVTAVNGAQTIVKGFNIASISRTAAGQFTVTFAAALPDANYGMQTFHIVDSRASVGANVNGNWVNSPTTAAFTWLSYNGSTAVDPASDILIAVYG